MVAEQAVLAWLRDRGAEAIDHPGGTLYTHLSRVHDRLAGLGAGDGVRLAGLTHAAYGTDGFAVSLLDLTQRPVLRDLVGAEAESLVYRYGACDRRRTWQDLARTGEVADRFTGEVQVLSGDDLRGFVDLTIVNELDVVEQDEAARQRYGGYLGSLFDGWSSVATPPVAAEARRVLAA